MERHEFHDMLQQNRICGNERSRLIEKCQENG